MFNIIRSLTIDYVLFSLIEGYIFCLFFEKVGGIKKAKKYEIMIIALINCLVSNIIPPVLFQLFGIAYMGLIIKFRDNIKISDSIRLSIYASTYLMTLEILYSFFMSVFINLDSFNTNEFILFFVIIPIRVIEIEILKRGSKKMKEMKWWIGEIEKPQEEVKTKESK